MKIGMIGLGKMGLSLVQNMQEHEMQVVGFDPNGEIMEKAGSLGVQMMDSVETLVKQLPTHKVVWLMVPAGDSTRQTVQKLAELLQQGDFVIDGGNSNYKDSIFNYNFLAKKGIRFFDCGTSGGVSGARYGGNFMIGGDAEAFDYIEEIFKKIAQKNGYLFTGAPGSGHYLKMVHNGIEYGMMQAIAEGFDLLAHSPYQYDNEKVSILWNNGSVIRSWLIELLADAFAKDPKLDGIKGIMESSGEGKWTLEEALERQVAMPVVAASLMMRYRSLEEDTFTGKVVASLRREFGGHAVRR